MRRFTQLTHTKTAARRERLFVLLIVAMTGALGVAHALITPTWANPEEPGHYEHVRLRAESGRQPDADNRDEALLAEIESSRVWVHHTIGEAGRMRNDLLFGIAETDRWVELRDELRLRPGYAPVGGGASQLQEPAGYYILSAALLRPFLGASLDVQALVIRLGSVVMGMAAVGMAYVMVRELMPDDRRSRLIIPALMGAHSGFVVMASSVNNTVLATLAMTIALYASIRAIRRGLSPINISLLALGAGMCLVSKPTALAGAGAAIVAPLLCLRGVRLRRAAIGLGAISLAGTLLALGWQRPVAWYPLLPGQAEAADDAPHGGWTLRPQQPGGLWQMLAPESARRLAGETVTIGYWSDDSMAEGALELWAAADQERGVPIDPRLATTQAGQSGWTYHALLIDLPASVQCVGLKLKTGRYDALSMVAGDYTGGPPLTFDNRDGSAVGANGERLENAIRNGSGERGWPMLRPFVTKLIPERLADSGLAPNRRLANFFDLGGNGELIWQSARWLFSSFWARFGWTAPGYPRAVVIGLGVLSAAAVAGMARVFEDSGGIDAWQGRAMLLVGISLAALWGLALLRLDAPSIAGKCDRYQGRFISVGYYLIPGVAPMLMVFYVGLKRWFKARERWLSGLLLLMMFWLAVGSLIGRQIPAFLHFYGIDLDPGLWTIVW